ncbi:hypothetical protein BDP27DRAFT_1323229 [Rhodocollybia butyracea]|uniref:NACHT domain-containing protein n=1 Tax=Rhodocollybia butyracea TaxID=206335 RepID=A0A9P5U956_9AGAR|nr:hypothetical protein BDP27DRAFT_1323229 [Rhodocollybia butyracea]
MSLSAAIPLANSIVEFLRLASHVIEVGRANNDAEWHKLAAHCQTINSSMRVTEGCLTQDEHALENLGYRCRKVSDDLLLRLHKLAPAERESSTKDVLIKEDIETLAIRISEFQSELEMNVVPFLRAAINPQLETLPALDTELSQLIHSASGNLSLLSKRFDAQDAPMKTQSHGLLHQLDPTPVDHASLDDTLPDPSNPIWAGKTNIIQDFILDGLAFTSMKDREEQVAEAHHDTFGWIFQDVNGPGGSFRRWLNSDDQGGLYWINGKAGSGKSTLMRFIYDHPTTTEQLRVWAGAKPLAMAGFFFWTSGSPEQRSQTGLVRYLLFQLLQQHRELIPTVFAELWKSCWNATTKERIQMSLAWSLAQLMESLKLLLRHASRKTRICLFIDGLDEFDGDHKEIIQLFRDIVNSDTKVCLSSRPWLVFEASFDSIPSLRLQDLTFNDMARYVNDNLRKDARIRRILKKEPSVELVSELAKRADGVFLWVTLVTGILVKQFEAGDTVSHLSRRLRILPTDLDDLFRYMLFDARDASEIKDMSQVFQLIRAREVVSDFTRNDNSASLTIYALALADEESLKLALKVPIQRVSDEELLELCQQTKDRLSGCCAGLLEVHEKHDSNNNIRFVGEDDQADSSLVACGKVNYIHRTVRDFIMSPGVWNDLLQYSGDFDAHLWHLGSCVLQLKLRFVEPKRHRRLDEWWPDIVVAMTHARYVERDWQIGTMLLDELNKTMDWYWLKRGTGDDNWARNTFWTYEMRGKMVFHDPFLSLATKFGLVHYVDAKLATGEFGYKGGIPLLTYATEYLFNRRQSIYPLSSPDLVAVLLKHGADPNLHYPGLASKDETPWLSTLKHARQAYRLGWFTYYDTSTRWVDALRLLIEHGADPNAFISETMKDPAVNVAQLIDLILTRFGSKDVYDLRETLMEHLKETTRLV